MRKEEEQMTLLLSREELKSTSFCLLKRRTTFFVCVYIITHVFTWFISIPMALHSSIIK